MAPIVQAIARLTQPRAVGRKPREQVVADALSGAHLAVIAQLALPVPHKCSLGSVMLVKSSEFVA